MSKVTINQSSSANIRIILLDEIRLMGFDGKNVPFFLSINNFISLLASNLSIRCKCSKYNAPGGVLDLANVDFFSVPFVKIAKHGISWKFLLMSATDENAYGEIN